MQVVDFARRVDRAERRPAAGFETSIHTADRIARPSLVMPVPARAIWSLPLPRRGVFRAFVTLDAAGHPSTPVRFRVGVSDDRVYEGLAAREVQGEPGWTEVRADLSAFAGFKWSLFYRPDRVTWRVVLSTDAIGPAPARAVWGSPELITDGRAAREYVRRIQPAP